MSNIVPLRQDPMIWVCACGCTTFLMLSDGSGECAACGKEHDFDGSGWVAGDDVRGKADKFFSDVQGNGSVEFARLRVQQMAQGDDVTAVVVLRQDGSIHTWSAIETDEQAQWLSKKLDEAAALIIRRVEK